MSGKANAFIVELIETAWYVAVGYIGWCFLIYFGVYPSIELNVFAFLFIWLATFIIGDYLVMKFDGWVFKRKVKKAAVEIAKARGLDPKIFDYKDIELVRDEENNIVDVVIKEKKK